MLTNQELAKRRLSYIIQLARKGLERLETLRKNLDGGEYMSAASEVQREVGTLIDDIKPTAYGHHDHLPEISGQIERKPT